MKFVIKDPANKDIRLPERGSLYAAGYDLRSIESLEIKPGERKLIATGIGWERVSDLQDCNKVGFIKPRSGLAYKQGIDVLAGVIDNDYEGEIKVLLINHGTETFNVEVGDRIAQLVIQDFYLAINDDMNTHNRGEGGFGSTGTK